MKTNLLGNIVRDAVSGLDGTCTGITVREYGSATGRVEPDIRAGMPEELGQVGRGVDIPLGRLKALPSGYEWEADEPEEVYVDDGTAAAYLGKKVTDKLTKLSGTCTGVMYTMDGDVLLVIGYPDRHKPECLREQALDIGRVLLTGAAAQA